MDFSREFLRSPHRNCASVQSYPCCTQLCHVTHLFDLPPEARFSIVCLATLHGCKEHKACVALSQSQSREPTCRDMPHRWTPCPLHVGRTWRTKGTRTGSVSSVLELGFSCLRKALAPCLSLAGGGPRNDTFNVGYPRETTESRPSPV